MEVKDKASLLKDRHHSSLGKKTSVDFITRPNNRNNDQQSLVAAESNISAQGPRRRIIKTVVSKKEIDSKSLEELKNRFVKVDRRGTMKKFHTKETQSRKEDAAIKEFEKVKDAEFFEMTHGSIP